MHGVRREYEIDDNTLRERREEQEKQAAAWNKVLADLAACQLPSGAFIEVMKATAGVVSLNPDYYQAWNIRKRSMLLHKDQVNLKEELGLNVECIKVNPKSYYAWYHRRWVLANWFPKGMPFNAEHELHLCQLLLDLDKRNCTTIHCWNYRKWLAEHFDLSVQDEFDFTGRKVFQNFSNYSAWHRRSQLMLKAYPDPAQLHDITQADLRLVKNAYYTEPADQSAWFYLKWLIEVAKRDPSIEWRKTVQQEIVNIKELLTIEPDAPLALLCLINLKAAIADLNEAPELVSHLSKVDPQRAGFYYSLLS